MKLRFESRVHDDDTYTIWAIDREPASAKAQHAWHIADVWFNGGEWLYLKYDRSGKAIHEAPFRWLDIDRAQWAGLRNFTNHVNEKRAERTEAENAGLDALLATKRLEFREDTREDARLWGVAMARIWAKTLFNL